MTARVRQISWVLGHLDNLRSDFSVLHRVDEIEQLPAPRFFAYCYRMSSYTGVMAGVVARQIEARGSASRGRRREISLAEWAAQNRDQVEAAAARMSGEGR